MNNAGRYAKTADRWVNELWNVSLLPAPALPANEAVPRPRKLEIVADGRRAGSNVRSLKVSTPRESDILARHFQPSEEPWRPLSLTPTSGT
jgi:hypothetical protein